VPVKARTLSRRLVSTTHPSLREADFPSSILARMPILLV
jgi:hypothetical protein